MRRILLFYPKLSIGGAERTLVNIINNLDNKKFELHVCLISKSGEFTSLLNSQTIIHELGSERLLFSLFPLIRKIISIKPDVIFSSLLHPNVLCYFAAKLSFFKGRVVLRETNNHTAAGRKKFNLSYFLVKMAYHGCSNIIALSEGVKADLISRYNIDPEKIFRIYNPISLESIKLLMKDESKEVEKVTLDPNNFNIISVGRLTKQKGYDFLINAFIANAEFIRNQKLFILGSGPELLNLQNQIKINSQKENIFLPGSFKNPFKVIKNADLFVLSSSWEGFGHVIVEAMACGIPVLSTNCPSGPDEIITDMENGILCEFNSVEELQKKMKYFYDHQEIGKDLVKNASSSILRFDEKLIIKEYQKAFLI